MGCSGNGPVIDEAARDAIKATLNAIKQRGHRIVFDGMTAVGMSMDGDLVGSVMTFTCPHCRDFCKKVSEEVFGAPN